MKKLVLLICAALSLEANAQNNLKVSQGSIGIGFHAACPQSELKDIKYDDGFGLNLSYLTRKYPYQSKINFQVGMQLDFANMKSKTFNDLELSDPNIIGKGTIKATNNMYGTFGMVRINGGSDDDKFVPYLNLLVGHRNYSTRQHLSLDLPAENPGYQSDTTTTRVVHTSRFHYGAGIGCSYKINDNFSVESGITYTFGGTGAALPLTNIKQVEGTSEVDYRDYKIVKTDILLINLGIRIHLYKRYGESTQTPNNQPRSTPSNTRYEDTNTTTTTPKTSDPVIKSRDSSNPTDNSPTNNSDKKSPIKPKGSDVIKGSGKG